jgi:hypothetical protein
MADVDVNAAPDKVKVPPTVIFAVPPVKAPPPNAALFPKTRAFPPWMIVPLYVEFTVILLSVTGMSIVQFPTPPLSKLALSEVPGTEAPGVPPDELAQLLVLFQLDEVPATQKRVTAAVALLTIRVNNKRPDRA